MGIGIERCDCPPPPEGLRVRKPSDALRRRLYTALNDKTRWQEFDCFLTQLCDAVNDLPTDTVGKDSLAGPLGTHPTDTDALLAGQPAYIDNVGFVRPADHTNVLTAGAIGLAVEAASAMDTACIVYSGRLALADWTAVAGAVALVPGATYYLTAAGGITTTVPVPGVDVWHVNLGTAANATTLILDPQDPWQLTC